MSQLIKARTDAGELGKAVQAAYAALDTAPDDTARSAAAKKAKDMALKFTEANVRVTELEKEQKEREEIERLARQFTDVNAPPPAATTTTGAPAPDNYKSAADVATGKFFREGFLQSREAYREAGGPTDKMNALFSGDASSGGILIEERIAEYRDPGVTGTVMPGLVSTEPTDGPLLWPSSTNLAPADSDWSGEGYRAVPDGTEGTIDFDGTRIVPVSWNPNYQRVPQELLMNRGANVERIVMSSLNRLWELSKEKAITVGNGARMPVGFLSTAAGLKDDGVTANQTVPTQDANEVTWAGILNLIYNVPEQWASNLTLTGLRLTYATILGIPDPAGNYIFQVASQAAPNTVLGYPYAANQYMPAVAANAYPLAIGNWKAAYVWAFTPGSERVVRYEDSNFGPGSVGFAITAIVNGAVVEEDAIRLLKVAVAVP